jgi:hypothetical protein
LTTLAISTLTSRLYLSVTLRAPAAGFAVATATFYGDSRDRVRVGCNVHTGTAPNGRDAVVSTNPALFDADFVGGSISRTFPVEAGDTNIRLSCHREFGPSGLFNLRQGSLTVVYVPQRMMP